MAQAYKRNRGTPPRRMSEYFQIQPYVIRNAITIYFPQFTAFILFNLYLATIVDYKRSHQKC